MVAYIVDKDLGLVLKPSESGRMKDTVTVALKAGAPFVLFFGVDSSAARAA
jgi:hypothetical protein